MTEIVHRRLFDWRLIMALTLALAALFGVFAGVMAFQGETRKDQQNRALFNQNAELIAQIKAQDTADAENTSRASENQLLLLEYTQQLARRQDALLAYLRRHGIHLPTRYITEIPPPRLRVITRTVTAPNGHTAAPGQVKKRNREHGRKEGKR